MKKKYYAITTEMVFKKTILVPIEEVENIEQAEEIVDALTGEFDGFSYASWRANAVYRTLEDMLYEGIIAEKEYRECERL